MMPFEHVPKYVVLRTRICFMGGASTLSSLVMLGSWMVMVFGCVLDILYHRVSGSACLMCLDFLGAFACSGGIGASLGGSLLECCEVFGGALCAPLVVGDKHSGVQVVLAFVVVSRFCTVAVCMWCWSASSAPHSSHCGDGLFPFLCS